MPAGIEVFLMHRNKLAHSSGFLNAVVRRAQMFLWQMPDACTIMDDHDHNYIQSIHIRVTEDGGGALLLDPGRSCLVCLDQTRRERDEADFPNLSGTVQFSSAVLGN
ncbi:hypothetical protein LZ554_006754 [Drepanopeziza brunnea f. sp. 'monogermtubi']|nr:hypothetical protein LZ554_006754 [Drepanopeziza brunnea f. sp. 'monogermtubi']